MTDHTHESDSPEITPIPSRSSLDPESLRTLAQNRFNDVQRLVVILSYEEGLTNPEIAGILDLPEEETAAIHDEMMQELRLHLASVAEGAD